jgi:hypothetical protein
MTFRAKPVVKRAHRPAWEARDRRNFFLNLGFGLIVLLAVVILAVAAGLPYHNDHRPRSAASTASPSRRTVQHRMTVESWRPASRATATAVLPGT